MYLIIGIILSALHAFFTAKMHERKIRQLRRNGGNNYSSGFGGAVIKFVLSVGISFVMAWVAFPIETYWELLFCVFGVTYSLGIFWFLFDGFLNRLLGRAWSYVSTTNEKFTDRIFNGSYTKQIIVKSATIIVGIIGMALIITLTL